MNLLMFLSGVFFYVANMLGESIQTVSDADVLRCTVVYVHCDVFRHTFKSHHQAN
jgi:hypothetical protein